MTQLHPMISRLLAITLLVALAGAVHLLVIQPLQQRAADLEESITLSESLLERLTQQPGDPKALMRRRDALAQEKPQPTGLLRGNNESIAGAFVQSFLTSTIEGRGGSVRSIQVLPVRPENDLRRVSARAQLRITAIGLRDLLHRIEGAQPYLFVDNLDIRSSQQPGSKQAAHEDVPLLVRFDIYGYMTAAPAAGEQL